MDATCTLSIGTPGDDDEILYEEDFRKGSKFLSKVKHKYKYTCKSGERITAIVAQDRWSDDTGGNPKLVSGGPGYSHVEVEVTSQMGHEFHFRLVYGTKK